ncbi:MAG: DNA replication/repair protein RecF [Actinobacteria bacterium]|nr:DNA replication/repair protein RecF [Actinomycetota bacterium]MCG2797697.1 DNA replication/repair protein RecF [Cellulomonas sp.]
MHVAHLSLVDFRSYTHVELPLDPGVTALIGPNGQGKTNLVEAIGYVATLGSHRVPGDAPLVRSGADRALVRMRAVRGDRAATVELEITPGKANRARLNGGSPVRAREVLGIVRTVLFAPEDLALVKGDPDGRRRYLDDLLVQRTPRLSGVLSDLDRVLRQRSALLKTAGTAMRAHRQSVDLRTLDVWDSKLAQIGAQVLVARRALVDQLRPHVAQAYEQVSSGQGAADLTYKASLDAVLELEPGTQAGPDLVEAQLLEAMGQLRSKEIERGTSLVGPHRDDLLLELGGLPARGYASHGESWSFALALRLASYRLLTEGDGLEFEQDGEPVLLLDDVFAELDVRRRDRLAELVAGAGQVIITAAVPQDVPEPLVGARVDVMGGEVTRVL